MTSKHRLTIAVIVALAFSTAALAQMGPRMGPPGVRGKWTPVVGQGAAYSVEARGQKMEMQVAVVGAEPPGHWLETVMNDPRAGGEVVMKVLVVVNGSETKNVRMIMQAPGQEPMEMSMEMMQMMGGRGRPQNTEADLTNQGTRVGEESITVPAGTFACVHWKSKDGADAWISEKAGPYQLVKLVSPDATMVLTKVISDAKTRIKGTPKKMEDMMRERP